MRAEAEHPELYYTAEAITKWSYITYNPNNILASLGGAPGTILYLKFSLE